MPKACRQFGIRVTYALRAIARATDRLGRSRRRPNFHSRALQVFGEGLHSDTSRGSTEGRRVLSLERGWPSDLAACCSAHARSRPRRSASAALRRTTDDEQAQRLAERQCQLGISRSPCRNRHQTGACRGTAFKPCGRGPIRPPNLAGSRETARTEERLTRTGLHCAAAPQRAG